MRESYGNTLLITVMMIFVVMMVSFTAVIVNIAKTFRVKNQIIDYVEQYKYGSGTTDGECIDKIDQYLSETGYQIINEKIGCTGEKDYWGSKGYCISSVGSGDNTYYKITVYVSVSLPFFGGSLRLPISGESRAPVSLN